MNDYPTVVRADYVFACMKANGETRRALEQCSCSIDVVASVIPYDRYVKAETVLSMSQVVGNLGIAVPLDGTGKDSGGRPASRPGRGRSALFLARYISDATAGHSRRNIFPSVSLASTLNVAAPLGR